MQDGAPVSSAGRKLERVSNGAPRGMAATRAALARASRVHRIRLIGLLCLSYFADAQPATISNECVSSAVFAIMIDAEQYLSCDKLMARSTVAGFKFFPVTVK